MMSTGLTSFSFPSIRSLVESVASGMNPVSGLAKPEGVIRMIVSNHLDKVAEEIGIRIVGFDLHGSRLRGDSRPDSDLDVVFEYDDGDDSGEVETREDFVFNEMSMFPLSIDGIKVDFNPINASETGTLEDYMAKDREYDKAKSTDAEYLAAVKRGDMKECSRLVLEAAAKAMPNTKVVDKDGFPMVVYHGTSKYGFTKFRSNTGVWVSIDKSYAEEYHESGGFRNPGTYSLFADIRKPIILGNLNRAFHPEDMEYLADKMGVKWSELKEWFDDEGYDVESSNIPHYEVTSNPLYIEWLEVLGFDGIRAEERFDGSVTTWCAFNTSRIKSADPITYDDDGNVIPLSRRFDMSNPDIRW